MKGPTGPDEGQEGITTTPTEGRAPEYELEQYFPTSRQIPEAREEALKDELGYLRAFFVSHPGRFRRLQKWLNQGRFGTTYDAYLMNASYYAAGAGVFGMVLGLLLTAVLARTGVLAGVVSPVGVPPDNVLVGFFEVVTRYRVVIAGTLLTGIGFASFGGVTWSAFYFYPRMAADRRRRNINVLLPHALVYMYALAQGGRNTFDVIESIADAEDAYGAVAEEFDLIVRDIEIFGNDLYTSVRDARNITPSENFEKFLDDMLNALDSGSDFTSFLEEESGRYLQQAREEQNAFLEMLSLLSEIFVAGFVAAPLFLIVTLMMVSLMGGDAIQTVFVIVYVVLPLGMLLLYLMIDYLSQPFTPPSEILTLDHELDDTMDTIAHQSDVETISTYVTNPVNRLREMFRREETEVRVTDGGTDALRRGRNPAVVLWEDQRYQRFRRKHRKQLLWHVLKTPLKQFTERTHYASFLVSVPLAAVAVWFASTAGLATPSVSAFTETPLRTSLWFGVVPFLVIAVPLAGLYEAERRRVERISNRFPEVLHIIASANQMGIPLTDSLMLVSRWSEGVLAEELRKLRNDITWNYNVKWALIRFANRVKTPQVTRTIKLIAEGSHSTTNLSKVINIAAEDTHNRRQLEDKRHTDLQTYLVIVIIGYLVYLAVIVMLNTSYLAPISELSTPSIPSGAGSSAFVNVGNVPVQSYRMVFFHTAIIQGVGTGLLAGKLVDGKAMSGLKYSIGLVVVAVGVFLFL